MTRKINNQKLPVPYQTLLFIVHHFFVFFLQMRMSAKLEAMIVMKMKIVATSLALMFVNFAHVKMDIKEMNRHKNVKVKKCEKVVCVPY